MTARHESWRNNTADAVAIIYFIGITAATIAFQMGWIS